jgi:hypothetical protein
MMAPGGMQILPQTDRDSGLLPNRMLSLWPQSRMNDPRVIWGDRYVILTQDVKNQDRFKIGYSNEMGWAAYVNQGHVFVKAFSFLPGAFYPDYGASSYEAFTAQYVMEMESLSPLGMLNPEETIEHKETWNLFQEINPLQNEAEISQFEEQYLQKKGEQ